MDKQLQGFVPRFPFGLLRGSLQAGKGTQQLPQLSLGCSQLGRSILLLVSVREGCPWDYSAGSHPGAWLLEQEQEPTPCPCVKSGITGAEPWQGRVPSSAASPPAFCGIPALPLRPCWEGRKNPQQVHPEGQTKTKVRPGSMSQARAGPGSR